MATFAPLLGGGAGADTPATRAAAAAIRNARSEGTQSTSASRGDPADAHHGAHHERHLLGFGHFFFKGDRKELRRAISTAKKQLN